MRDHRHWRDRPTSRRRKVLASLSVDEVFDERSGRMRECYSFFADFWSSTPHPVAQMVLVVGWSIAVAVMNDTRVWGAGLKLDANAGRTLTTVVAFLIVFRTNQSYNRWWEGRILWGKMHWWGLGMLVIVEICISLALAPGCVWAAVGFRISPSDTFFCKYVQTLRWDSAWLALELKHSSRAFRCID